MNLQQLEYIVAVADHRHFVKAAEKCFVTQATLSAMIKKLEDELGIQIFDRSHQPVTPTLLGEKVIAQAKLILQQTRHMFDMVNEERESLKGYLRLGIIPTLAPYLLPSVLSDFLHKHPKIKLKVNELTTEDLIQRLQHHDLDLAILATPLHKHNLLETPLFYESFHVYSNREEKRLSKKFILPQDIQTTKLWLLEEGHCMRNQMMQLCALKSKEKQVQQLDFETGSIETLVHLVDYSGGATILPQLAIHHLNEEQQERIRPFKSPIPVREISLVTHQHFTKHKLADAFKQSILDFIPEEMKQRRKKEILDI